MQQDSTSLVLLTTAPDLPCANRIAKELVQLGLAACVNVLPAMTSYYLWQGELQTDSEHQLIIKTQQARMADVEAYLEKHHPYDVPELLALAIESGSKQYLTWLNECLT